MDDASVQGQIEVVAPSSPVRPKWTAVDLAVVLAVVFFCAGIVSLPSGWLRSLSPWMALIIGAILPQLFMLVYPIVRAKRRGCGAMFAWPGLRKLITEACVSVGVVVGMLIVMAMVRLAVRAVWPSALPSRSFWEGVASAANPAILAVLLLESFTLAPLAEEVFFRGLLYNALRSRMPAVAAIVIQAFIFVAGHLYTREWTSMVAAFFIGTVLALVYEWRKSLVTPILVHAGNNLLMALVIFHAMNAQANIPVLGVECRDTPRGCVVRSVIQGSAAEKTGILPYDVITDVDGRRIQDFADLIRTVQSHKAGDTVVVGVDRGQEHIAFRAVLQKKSRAP